MLVINREIAPGNEHTFELRSKWFRVDYWGPSRSAPLTYAYEDIWWPAEVTVEDSNGRPQAYKLGPMRYGMQWQAPPGTTIVQLRIGFDALVAASPPQRADITLHAGSELDYPLFEQRAMVAVPPLYTRSIRGSHTILGGDTTWHLVAAKPTGWRFQFTRTILSAKTPSAGPMEVGLGGDSTSVWYHTSGPPLELGNIDLDVYVKGQAAGDVIVYWTIMLGSPAGVLAQ